MPYKSSDVVRLAPKGISAVHDLSQAPASNALSDVLFLLWNTGGPDHKLTIDEIVEGLNWNVNTFGRLDFTPEFSTLVNRRYVTITSAERPKGWDVELSSGKVIHEDLGDYDYIADKYPLAVDIRRVE